MHLNTRASFKIPKIETVLSVTEYVQLPRKKHSLLRFVSTKSKKKFEPLFTLELIQNPRNGNPREEFATYLPYLYTAIQSILHIQ